MAVKDARPIGAAGAFLAPRVYCYCLLSGSGSDEPGASCSGAQCDGGASALEFSPADQREESLPALDIPSSQVLHPEFIPYGTRSMIASIW